MIFKINFFYSIANGKKYKTKLNNLKNKGNGYHEQKYII